MGPHNSFSEYLELTGRLVVPYALMAGLFVLNVVSVPYPLAAFFKAPFLLMALYYWCVFRPTLLPPLLVFLGGLALDFLTGMPPGLSAVLFLLCRIAVVDQRRFLMGQGFMMIWIGFGFLSLGYHLLQWGIFVMLNTGWVPMDDLGSSFLLGLALFPVVYIVLHITHKILPAPNVAGKTSLGSQSPNVSL